MLALAATPSHDHSSTYASTVTAVSAPQPARPKSTARRAVSTTSLKQTPRHPLTSTASTSSNTTILPPKLSRSGALPPRPNAAHASKAEATAQRVQQMMGPNAGYPMVGSDGRGEADESYAATVAVKDGKPVVDISSFRTNELLHTIASMLTETATANDALPHDNAERPGIETPIWETLFTASQSAFSTKSSSIIFHARNIPTISLEAYFARILRYCPTTNEVFIALLVYFDRLSKLSEEATGSRFLIDSYNVHRLVIAGVTVASKFFSDVFYTNSRYAKVGGLPQAELNALELQLLLLMDFRLSISSEEMQEYALRIVEYSQQMPDALSICFEPISAPPMVRSGPLHSMGAFDAFGGNIQNDQNVQPTANHAPRNATPKRNSTIAHSARDETRDTSEERDQESSVYSETDTDAETDDEPTIKASHSCASSDTQSLFSNDASEASFGANEDEDDDGSETDEEHKTPEREYAHHRRWHSREHGSSDNNINNRHMASP